MKIAVIGRGKTGRHVEELLQSSDKLHAAYDRSHPASVEALSQADAVIVFTPGDAVGELVPVLMEAGRPTVWGSTGCTWDPAWGAMLKERALPPWIHASNFSLGMVLVRRMLQTLAASSSMLPEAQYQIHEVHHAAKKDGPSGTALSWREYMGEVQGDCLPITFDRQGDEIGTHHLCISTPWEEIRLEHRSLDRRLFAQGAIWAAERLYFKDFTKPGLHSFEELTESVFTLPL